MKIFIENTALESLVNIYLTGYQHLPADVEKRVMDYYIAQRDSRYINYCEFLDIVTEEQRESCFYRLREFVIYSIIDIGQELFITREDVFRLFSTMFQWRLLKRELVNEYEMILHIPTWFTGNMLLPSILKKENGKYIAEYSYEDRIITIKNVIIPPGLEPEINTHCAVYLSTVISPLNKSNFNMISRHLEEIAPFRLFRKDVETIDYSDFQRFGNYGKRAIARFDAYAEIAM
jgi:hypothetical protein